MARRQRLGVVSYLAHQQFAPRGVRTRAVLEALAEAWDIDLVAGPTRDVVGPAPLAIWLAQHLGYRLGQTVALDSIEFWSRVRLSRWRTPIDGALLIGLPFSPVAVAADRLGRRGVPYVVDASDPWALTAEAPSVRGLAIRRAQAAERRLWERAAGAVVTTRAQGEVIHGMFGHFPILVRPNGYTEVGAPSQRHARSPRNGPPALRLAHFGNLYSPRIDVEPFFRQLIASGRWERVVFEQFGGDWNETLRRLPSVVEVTVHRPLPWADVISEAQRFDAALVVGNVGAAQLPSKVVEYLTLPIPRVAVLDDPDEDPITEYLEDKPGWLLVSASDRDAASKVAAHVDAVWTEESLRAPHGESWSEVGNEIARFVSECLRVSR